MDNIPASSALELPDFTDPTFIAAPEIWRSHARNTYSQCGEDGILEQIFNRIGITDRTCFEVGAADGRFCSNTRRLIDEGWHAWLIDGDEEKYCELETLASDKVKTLCRMVEIDGENSLDNLLLSMGCPKQPDLGVIDVDGPDYYVFNSMIHIRPRVVVVEYDPHAAPEFVPEKNGFGQAGFFSLCSIAQAKGYSLAVTTRFNLIFLAQEATPKLSNLKLNIGGGTGPQREGYEVVDRKDGKEAYPLDYPDGCASEIVASHVLEHFSHRKTFDVLKDWVRVLEPGGRIRIAVPDYNWVVDQQNAGNRNPMMEFFLLGGHVDENDHHGALFSDNKLRALMRMVGLRRVRHWKSEIEDCASLPVSLNLEGYKPKPISVESTCGLMSLPRYMPTATFNNVSNALRMAGNVELRCAWGAYWHETLTVGTEAILADPAKYKYILFIDFDSVFSNEEVAELYRIMENHPELDAVCPLQVGRYADKPLLVATDESGKPVESVSLEWTESDAAPIQSGHFGCTFIRTEAMRKLKKPWFNAKPTSDGSWRGEGYVSADVNFWREFTSQGFKLASANRVAIGHIEEMILWPDRELGCVHQKMGDYRNFGPPPESWR